MAATSDGNLDACITGRLTAGQALAQILTLPALILGLGLFVAVLKATL